MPDASPNTREPFDTGARLQELLAEIDSAARVPRSDPAARHQLALCAEVESILRMRAERRAPHQQAA